MGAGQLFTHWFRKSTDVRKCADQHGQARFVRPQGELVIARRPPSHARASRRAAGELASARPGLASQAALGAHLPPPSEAIAEGAQAEKAERGGADDRERTRVERWRIER